MARYTFNHRQLKGVVSRNLGSFDQFQRKEGKVKTITHFNHGLHHGYGHTEEEGGGSYHADAVHIDENVLLSIAMLSAADSGLLSFSGWIKISSNDNNLYLFNLDPDNNVNDFHLNEATPGNLETIAGFLQFANTDFSSFAGFTSDPGLLSAGEWHNILLSANMNLGSGSKIAALYIDDVQIPVTLSDSHSAFQMSWSPGLSILSAYAGFNAAFDAADIWFAPGVSLLTGSAIAESDRRKFISVDGKPVDPSGFPASAILFSGNASGFPINQGSGGSFTLTGSLSNASSSPSD